MNIKKGLSRLTAFGMAVFLTVALSGCIKIEAENGTIFELDEDGKITQVIVDDADESVTGEELENYINEKITAFQSNNNQDFVSLEKCAVNSGKVNIALIYSSISAYAGFNNVSCFNGTVLEAYNAGYDFNRVFHDMDGNEIPYYELARYCRDGNVLILKESAEIRLPGETTAMSEQVDVTDDGRIVVSDIASDELDSEYQATTPSLQFVIYNLEK